MGAGSGDIRAGRAFVEIGTNDSALAKGLDAAKARMSAFAGALGSLGSALALGFVTNKITGWVEAFAESGREIYLMARAAGIGAAELSELKGAVGLLGGDLDTTVASMRKMGIFLHDAATGGKEASDAMRELGLSMADIAGKSEIDKLQIIGEKLAGLSLNARQALGQKIFGKGGGATVGLAAALGAARTQTAGGGQTEAEIKAAFDLSQALGALDRAQKSVYKTIAAALAPAFTLVAESMTSAVKQVKSWVRENIELVQKIALVGSVSFGAGTAILTIGTVANLASFAWSGFASAIGSAMSLVSATAGIVITLLNPMKYLAALAYIGTKTMTGLKIAFAATKAVVLALTSAQAMLTLVMSLSTAATAAATAPLTLLPVVIGAVVVALGALGAYMFSQSATGQRWASSISAGFMRVKEVFGQAFAGIKDAISAGDLGMAFEIGIAGMKVIASEFNDWFGREFGITITSAFEKMRFAFEVAIEAMKIAWSGFQAFIAPPTEGSFGSQLTSAQIDREIEERIRALGGTPATAPTAAGLLAATAATAHGAGGSLTAELQRQLDDLNEEAAWQAYAAIINAKPNLPNTNDIAGQLGQSSARSTFSRDALFGFGGSPINQLISSTKEIVDKLAPILASIEEGVWMMGSATEVS